MKAANDQYWYTVGKYYILNYLDINLKLLPHNYKDYDGDINTA